MGRGGEGFLNRFKRIWKPTSSTSWGVPEAIRDTPKFLSFIYAHLQNIKHLLMDVSPKKNHFQLTNEQLSFFETEHYLVLDSITLGILEPDFLDLVSRYILEKYSQNELKKSGVGTRIDVNSNIRGDFILWISENAHHPVELQVQDFFKSVLEYMNRNYFLGLKDYESHMTVYPSGSHYEKHIDVLKKKTLGLQRKLSLILYLNKDYTPKSEGELVLYDLEDNLVLKVAPEYGKIVLFMSDEFPHEVLTIKNRERISITAWFLG